MLISHDNFESRPTKQVLLLKSSTMFFCQTMEDFSEALMFCVLRLCHQSEELSVRTTKETIHDFFGGMLQQHKKEVKGDVDCQSIMGYNLETVNEKDLARNFVEFRVYRKY